MSEDTQNLQKAGMQELLGFILGNTVSRTLGILLLSQEQNQGAESAVDQPIHKQLSIGNASVTGRGLAFYAIMPVLALISSIKSFQVHVVQPITKLHLRLLYKLFMSKWCEQPFTGEASNKMKHEKCDEMPMVK